MVCAYNCVRLAVCTRWQIYLHWIGMVATFLDGGENQRQLSYEHNSMSDDPAFAGYEDVQQHRRECKNATHGAAMQFVLASVVLFDTVVTINGFHRSEACAHHVRQKACPSRVVYVTCASWLAGAELALGRAHAVLFGSDGRAAHGEAAERRAGTCGGGAPLPFRLRPLLLRGGHAAAARVAVRRVP